MCATHSQPAFVDNAYWKGAVADSAFLETCLAMVLATNDDPSHPTIWLAECCEPAESERLDDGVWHIPVHQERPHLGK